MPKADVNKLTEEQKQLIINRLARYADPTEVVLEFQQKGITVSKQQVSFYDPTTAQGAAELPLERKETFWRIRAEHDEEILKKLPPSRRDYRLMRLDRIISHPMLGMSKLGLKALEQAAKEMGGMYERPSEDKEGGDPNAIPQSLEDAVTKVYGEADAAHSSGTDAGNADGSGNQQDSGSGSQAR